MSNLLARKQEYKKIADLDFKALVQQLEKETLHPNETYIEMLLTLEAYFLDMHELDPSEPNFDFSALIAVFSEEKDFKTYEQNYQIGRFVSALVRCGSPARQACMATGQLLEHKNRSPQTSQKAYNLFKNLERDGRGYEKGMDANQFVSLNSYRLNKFLMSVNQVFPSHPNVAKAKAAYDVLLGLIEESIAADEADMPAMT